MDLAASYGNEGQITERKRRAFWSFHILDAYHGHPMGAPDTLDSLWRDRDGHDKQHPSGPTPPSIPKEEHDSSEPTDYGIWSVLLQLAGAWKRARAFVQSCVSDKVREPWRSDSTYTRILSELMDSEGRTPMRHRWQIIKFYDQDQDGVSKNLLYWQQWLAVQITYHTAHAAINHPFLYMAATRQQHNKQLSVLNTFWTRSSQLALLHATWIVRVAEMISDRQVQLSDVIFGQAAAIAVTIHLYYLSAANPKLKLKSASDMVKAKRFLQTFKTSSPLCAELVSMLDDPSVCCIPR